MVDPGNLVQADVTALTSIVSLDPMYVYFDIDERTLLMIRRLIADKKMKSRTEAEIPVLVGPSRTRWTSRTGGRSTSATTRSTRGPARSGSGASSATPSPGLLSPGLFVRIRLPIGAPASRS